ncbi:MAG: hypothetical protein KKA73_21705 [Chloroflexi bacterium]|nr:hypothetical protein [Chloroflexota bacterium]MBU1750310.1 hypothetical protein [Chloroflexota bacterium]
MKRTWLVQIVLICLLIAAIGGGVWWFVLRPAPGPRENVTPPEGVVNNFYIALSEGAYSQAYGYLSTPYRQAHPLGEFVDMVRPIWDDVASITVQMGTPVIQGDTARVDVTLHATLREGVGPDRASFQGTLRLVREGARGAWWLDEVPAE